MVLVMPSVEMVHGAGAPETVPRRRDSLANPGPNRRGPWGRGVAPAAAVAPRCSHRTMAPDLKFHRRQLREHEGCEQQTQDVGQARHPGLTEDVVAACMDC